MRKLTYRISTLTVDERRPQTVTFEPSSEKLRSPYRAHSRDAGPALHRYIFSSRAQPLLLNDGPSQRTGVRTEISVYCSYQHVRKNFEPRVIDSSWAEQYRDAFGIINFCPSESYNRQAFSSHVTIDEHRG